MISMGCTNESWPPQKMFDPVNIPTENSSLHPWIVTLLKLDVADARKHLNERLACNSPAFLPLIKSMNDYVPVQVAFSSDVGYLRCVRKYKDEATGQTAYHAVYIAQPLSDDRLDAKVAYFNPEVQPLAREFVSRFAGSGEEMEGAGGQFTFKHWPSFSNFNSSEANLQGDWRDAKLLYSAQNGDSVFIKSDGATAWHTLETDKVTPIATTLEEFIELYAAFRGTEKSFDSWAYRNYLSDRPKQ
jgi:hypothetical protein